jgi:hypothetical protein
MSPAENETYHVVCRDCTFESLLFDPRDARELADDHAATANHATGYGRID